MKHKNAPPRDAPPRKLHHPPRRQSAPPPNSAKCNSPKSVKTPTKRRKQVGDSQRGKTDKPQGDAPPPKRLRTVRAIQDLSVVDRLQGNRKTPPESKTSGGELMCGASSKDSRGSLDAIVIDSPVAAAASSLLYNLHYGWGWNA